MLPPPVCPRGRRRETIPRAHRRLNSIGPRSDETGFEMGVESSLSGPNVAAQSAQYRRTFYRLPQSHYNMYLPPEALLWSYSLIQVSQDHHVTSGKSAVPPNLFMEESLGLPRPWAGRHMRRATNNVQKTLAEPIFGLNVRSSDGDELMKQAIVSRFCSTATTTCP